jgi:hypothetical protein
LKINKSANGNLVTYSLADLNANFATVIRDSKRNVSSKYERVLWTKGTHKDYFNRRRPTMLVGAIQQTNFIVDFVKQYSQFRMFAFRICEKKDLPNLLQKIKYSSDREVVDLNESEKSKEFREKGVFEIESSSFDKFYVIKMNEGEVENDLKLTGSESSNSLSKKFITFLEKKKGRNRAFLSLFVDFIS